MAFYLHLSPLIFHSEYFLSSFYSQYHVFSVIVQSQIVFHSAPVPYPTSTAKHRLPSQHNNWFQLAHAGDPWRYTLPRGAGWLWARCSPYDARQLLGHSTLGGGNIPGALCRQRSSAAVLVPRESYPRYGVRLLVPRETAAVAGEERESGTSFC